MGEISKFIETHFRHFNARETLEAAKGWNEFLGQGGKMFLAMAGAMSTAEIGRSLAEMIRKGKIHAISCTAANLEEDVFNLFAHNEYARVPNYRELRPEDEVALRDQGFNRVTDTCIPETVMRHIEKRLVERWSTAAQKNERFFPYEYFFDILRAKDLEKHYQIPRENSWVLAALDRGIPIFTPGWEDCTLANMFTANVMMGNVKSHAVLKTGTEQLEHLANWYRQQVKEQTSVGFFQIGGGIAGDFPICVVPMLIQDLQEDVPHWGYFAQITDSTTSYGSYSGASPSEKITWHKLSADTPRYAINSDASIVAPLIFAYILGW